MSDAHALPEPIQRIIREVGAARSASEGPTEGARRPGFAVLFAGPGGTGKTKAAHAAAHELGLNLQQVDLSRVVSKYIGDTEKNLERIFDEAENSGAILLLEEADALFGERTGVRESYDRYANVEVDYLLQRIQSHSGLVILTTNREDTVDRAFCNVPGSSSVFRNRSNLDGGIPGYAGSRSYRDQRLFWPRVIGCIKRTHLLSRGTNSLPRFAMARVTRIRVIVALGGRRLELLRSG